MRITNGESVEGRRAAEGRGNRLRSSAAGGLLQATSANMLNMIGSALSSRSRSSSPRWVGRRRDRGWILGAVIAIIDGMVWAELGARCPARVGPYHYLQEAYARNAWGG